MALAEAKAPFTRFEIDLQNKPEWYPKVHPATKVTSRPWTAENLTHSLRIVCAL